MRKVYMLRRHPRQIVSAGLPALFFAAIGLVVLFLPKARDWYALLFAALALVSIGMAWNEAAWRLRVEPECLAVRGFFLHDHIYPLAGIGRGVTQAGFLSPSAVDRALWSAGDAAYLGLFRLDGTQLACLDCDQATIELLMEQGVPIEWEGIPEEPRRPEPVNLRRNAGDWQIAAVLTALCLTGVFLCIPFLPFEKKAGGTLLLLAAGALVWSCLLVYAWRWRLLWEESTLTYRPGLGRSRTVSFAQIGEVSIKLNSSKNYKLLLYDRNGRMLCSVPCHSLSSLCHFLRKLLDEEVPLQKNGFSRSPLQGKWLV